jgi:class 3 adenylate cyclase/tetratricopeptide (TPR) repeat protein
MSDLEQWLKRHALGKYAQVFADNDVDLDVLSQLTEEHLKELGVSLGDRLRFTKAMGTLDDRAVIDTPVPSPSTQKTDAAISGGEAERRQLTVMFCDMVGSTALASKLDPEDLGEVIAAFQATCREAIERYGGFVARYMGDGMLNYFGYPQAHEDDAERAVRAGLAIVDAMGALNARIGERHGADLAVRVGVATGPVVVGDRVGEGAAEEAAVVGETPNLAARLQGVAGPDQVVVAPATHGLLEASFEYEDLGEHALKGIDTPVQAWRALRERDVHSRYEARQEGAGGTPLVGRQEELGLLLRSWESSKQGHGQAILVQGEAGIGKSRLVEALREHAAGDDHVWVAFRCSPYHANSALYPVIEHLKRAFGWSEESDAKEKLDKLEATLAAQSLPLAEVIPLYAELLSLPLPDERYPASDLNARQKREATLDALAAWLLEMAEQTPVLGVWEDLHWADPTTLELLALFLEQSPTVAMMNVLTYRSEFVPEWPMRSHMVPVTLNRLERPEVEALVGHRASGKRLPKEVVAHIVDKADGVPLYVEELTKTILESDFLREETDRFVLAGVLSELSIPATLQDSLMARLDRLPSLREVAQMGAVLGREFAYETLRAVVGLDEPQLQSGLEQLVADELLYQRGRLPRSKYIFKHALIQDAAYHSLLKKTRQDCHRRVAQLLEEQFPETVENNPELVAHHYTEGLETERAIAYWQKAGERARAQAANLEAIAYLTRGVEILEQLPDGEARARLELALQLSIGHANIVAKGHGSVDAETAYNRALALSESLGDTSDLVPALFGLWRSFIVGRTLTQSNDVALQLRQIADRKREPALEVVASYTLGATALWMGKLRDARANLQKSIELYRPSEDVSNIYRAAQDPGVACRAYLGNAEWLLGYPERAQSLVHESIGFAEKMNDRFSLSFALCFTGATVSELCGADTATLVMRGSKIALEDGYNLWIRYGNLQKAILRIESLDSDSAFAEFREYIDALLDIGVFLYSPYFMTRLAHAYMRSGRIAQALQILDEAQQSTESRGERWSEAEIHRVRGEILLARSQGDVDDAQSCFCQALDIARSQEARSLELRAAMSLVRLGQQQGNAHDARRQLDQCYAEFTEGSDTADLCEAKRLLDSTT